MSKPTNDHPAPPAPRLHRVLSNPIGWLGFLLLEGAAVLALIRALPLERLPIGIGFPAAVALVIATVVVNYRIRRIYLSDWWNVPGR